jgi:signal transduction histidine kinase
LIEHDVAFVALLDTARAGSTVSALSPRADDLHGLQFPAHETIAGAVMRTQFPVVNEPPSDGVQGRPEAGRTDPILSSLKTLGMQSLLIVPMRTGDETIGAMGICSSLPSAYRAQDLVLVQLLASGVAIAIRNLAVFGEAQRRLTQIELINEFAQRLTGSLEIDHLLRSIAEAVRKTFGYFDVTFFLLDPEEDEVVLVAHAGEKEDFLPANYRQKKTDGIVGWVATHGEKLIVDDVGKDSRYYVYAYQESRSELAIPIRVESEVVGVLNVEDRRLHAFDETDAIVLETMCDQLGAAVRNARLYEKLKKSHSRLTDLDRMKSDFLGIVSHDFRSPLATIVLAANALQKRWETFDQEKLNDYLDVIADQATRLGKLAEDVLSVALLETGKLTYHFTPVNLGRVVTDAASLVKFSSRHTFECLYDQGAPLVRADRSKLRQVVQNLLSNAVKYSPAGGAISLRVKDRSPDEILVSVQDQGIGISAQQMERLFQKFSRVESAATQGIGGSGLGLWICREIVRAHGGEIWAESEPGKGSTFIFSLKKAGADAKG